MKAVSPKNRRTFNIAVLLFCFFHINIVEWVTFLCYLSSKERKRDELTLRRQYCLFTFQASHSSLLSWIKSDLNIIYYRLSSDSLKKEFLELTFKEPHKHKGFLWWKKVLKVGKHFVEVTPALKKLWNKKATLLFWLLRRITRTQAPLFTCCGIFHMDILGNSTPLILLWKWQRALRGISSPAFLPGIWEVWIIRSGN